MAQAKSKDNMLKKILVLNLLVLATNKLAADTDSKSSEICVIDQKPKPRNSKECTIEQLHAVLTMSLTHGCGHRSNNAMLKHFAEIIKGCESGANGEPFNKEESYTNPYFVKCAHEFGSGKHHSLQKAIDMLNNKASN